LKIPKWGFGMAPISPRMQGRYDFAVQSMQALLNDESTLTEVDPESLSELKGMFNRCVRQDQWDWFSVYTQFGGPPRREIDQIVPLIVELRRAVIEGDGDAVCVAKKRLAAGNIIPYLNTFAAGGPQSNPDGTSGWLYVLSTKHQPTILKIGMTTRSVFERVKEINAATGVLHPYSARAVFRVPNAAIAERDIFRILSDFRIRPDREFFQLEFRAAVASIEKYLADALGEPPN